MYKIDKYILENVPDGHKFVDIAMEIQKYERKYKKSPIIVMSPTYSLNPKVKSRFKEYEFIKNAGGNVVFFKECPLIELNSTNRIDYSQDYSTKNFEKFLQSENTEHYDSFICNEQTNISALDSELTLTEFANSINAFAVLVNPRKSRLLHSGKCRYWSISHLNTENWSTIEFSIDALRKHLELPVDKMPLFEALCSRINASQPLTNLAYYVQNLPKEITFDVMIKISHFYKIPLRVLTLRIKYFKIPVVYNLVSKDARLLGHCHEMSFNILKGYPIPLIADQIDRETFNYAEILLPIVRKHAGILLQNKIEMKINIMTRKEDKNPLTIITESPIYPNINVPPLDKLFLRNEYPELDPIRWKLVFWCISDNSDIHKLITEPFIIPYLCIWYLIENKIIEKFEGDSVLLAIISLHTGNYESYKNWPKNLTIDKRAVQISLLYVNLCKDIKKMFCSIGFNDIENQLVLEGVIFLNIYKEMKSRNREMRKEFCKTLNFGIMLKSDSNILQQKDFCHNSSLPQQQQSANKMNSFKNFSDNQQNYDYVTTKPCKQIEKHDDILHKLMERLTTKKKIKHIKPSSKTKPENFILKNQDLKAKIPLNVKCMTKKIVKQIEPSSKTKPEYLILKKTHLKAKKVSLKKRNKKFERELEKEYEEELEKDDVLEELVLSENNLLGDDFSSDMLTWLESYPRKKNKNILRKQLRERSVKDKCLPWTYSDPLDGELW